MAPRAAARRASSPQPVPISRTRVPSFDAGLVQQPVDLGLLRGGQAVPGHVPQGVAAFREEGAGVRHGAVQERGEELVGEVVVPGDVGAGVLLGVAFPARLARQVEAAQLLQRLGHERADAGGEHLHHGGEVVGVPVAGHVGLAQADQAAVAEPGGEGFRPVDGHDGVGGAGSLVRRPAQCCFAQYCAVRVPDFQRQPAHGGLEDGVRGASGHTGLEARGHRGDAGPDGGVDGGGRLRERCRAPCWLRPAVDGAAVTALLRVVPCARPVPDPVASVIVTELPPVKGGVVF